MISYATNDYVCRSRQLLAYFGETDSHDCGHCDVCLEHKSLDLQDPEVLMAEAKRMIVEMLSDGNPHPVSDLHALALPYEPIEAALALLISEEQVSNDDGMLSLHTSLLPNTNGH